MKKEERGLSKDLDFIQSNRGLDVSGLLCPSLERKIWEMFTRRNQDCLLVLTVASDHGAWAG